jgi:alpha-glucoside transport system substrate-binding protein
VATILAEDLRAKPLEVLQPLIDTCGIQINFDFLDTDTALSDRASEAVPPDIIIGSDLHLREFKNRVEPLAELGVHQENYAAFWAEQTKFNGQLVALPLRVEVKSLIWYSPSAFEAAENQPPTSMDELSALVDKFASEGKTPWAMGIESGEPTGWAGTDFIQDILLATQGPDYVQGLIDGTIPYNDSAVRDAWILYASWAANPAYTPNGAEGTLTTSFYDAIFYPFKNPSEAMMVHQGHWVSPQLQANFPDLRYGTDYDFFIMPGVQALQATTYHAFAFRSTPAIQAVFAYLSSDRGGQAWAASNFEVSPNNASAGAYADPFQADLALAVAQSGGVVPDLGDTIGGSFTTAEFLGVATYVADPTTLDETLDQLTALQAEAASGQ